MKKEIWENFNFENIINDDSFKEDSVREEIISPFLNFLGFSYSNNNLERSKRLKDPYLTRGRTKILI